MSDTFPVLMRASRAAGDLVAHLREQGHPVRVMLTPDGVALFVPEAAVTEADPQTPPWRATLGLPVFIYS